MGAYQKLLTKAQLHEYDSAGYISLGTAPEKRYCADRGKVIYLTRDKAIAARGLIRGRYQGLNPYYCQACGGYHLGRKVKS